MRQFVDRLSIRSKIISGNAMLLALFMLGLGISLWLMQRVVEDTHHLRGELTPILGALGDIHGAGARVLGESGNFAALALLSRADASLRENTGASGDRLAADERNQMSEARFALRAAMLTLDAVLEALGGDDVAYHRQIAGLRARLAILVETMVAQSVEIERRVTIWPQEEAMELLEGLEDTEGTFEETIRDTKALAIAAAETLQAAIDGRLATARWVSLLTLVVGVALVASASFYVARRIADPIVALRDVARRFGAGDLDARPIRTSADEIGDLELAFTRMAGDLKDSMERQARQSRLAGLGELAGTVNHELRNPLTTISNSIITLGLRVPPGDPEVRKLIDRIDRNVERCIDIVGDFLDFARPPIADREETWFDSWLGRFLDEYELPASVALERRLDAPVGVDLDGERFRRVMINLLDNAVQAMTDTAWQPPPGAPRRITVKSAVAGGQLVLSVADTGPGIPPENIGRIFEPLFTTKSFGIGLGLAAVQRIVGQHGGTIEVDGSVAPGVCFKIRLPIVKHSLRGAA